MLTLLQGAAIVGASILLALAGMLAVRRLVSFESLRQHNEVAGFVYAVLGVAYAVLLAFVVVVVWEQFRDARTDAENEANDLAAIHRIAQGLPDPARVQVSELTATYLRTVIDDEWPAMARNAESARARELVDELWAVFYQLEPRTDRESNLHAQALDELSAFSAGRRTRLLAAREHVPPLLWWMLVEGGVITVAFTYFFGLRSLRAQALMTAALTGTLALVLFAILAMNHPFRGDLRVDPTAFQMTLKAVERQRG